MKNILNKLGYISKPAIIGMALGLGVATVSVGVGIMTQFTGDSGAGGISGSALGQYGGTLASSASNNSVYSREALEASMAAAEAARQQEDSVYSLKGAASADGFYYGKNAPQQQTVGNASSGADASSGNDGIEGLKGGSLSGMGGGGIAAVDGSNAMDPAAAAAQAATRQKAGAAQAAALDASSASSNDTGSGQLRTSQMAGSSGSGNAGSSGGSAALSGAGAEHGAGTRAIQQAPAGSLPNQQGDIVAFKGGRVGAMGGSNVRGGGQNGGLGAGQEGIGVGNSLYTSYNRTNAARGTVMGDASKGAADAASAFDGSVATEGIPAGDGNVRQGAVSGLSNNNSDLGGMAQQVKDKVDKIAKDVQTSKDLRKKIWGKMLLMGILVAGGCIMIGTGMKIGAPWGYVLAAAGALTAAGAIIGCSVEMFKMLKELKALKEANIGDTNYGWMMTAVIASIVVCGGAIAAAFVLGIKAAQEAALAKDAALAAAKAAGSTASAGSGAATGTVAGAGGATAGGGSGAMGAVVNTGTSIASNGIQSGMNNMNNSSSTIELDLNNKTGQYSNPYPKGSEEWYLAEQEIAKLSGGQ